MASAQAASRPSIFHVAILLLGLVGCAHATLYRINSNDAPVGYYLQKLNAVTPQTFVASLNTSALSAATTKSFFTSLQFRRPTIVSGVLTGRKLTISTAYLGLPGLTPQGLYYTVINGSVNYNASLVNTARTVGVLKKNSTLTLTGNFLDTSWQERQVLRKGAIISAATLGGPSLKATEVFVKLPTRVGPCPLLPIRVCANETFTRTFRRTPDLCVLPADCKDLTQVFCPQFFPSCSPGYTLHSWLGASGCPAFACDPDFIEGL